MWLTEEFSDDLKFQKNKDVSKEDYRKVGSVNDKVQNDLDWWRMLRITTRASSDMFRGKEKKKNLFSENVDMLS